MWPSLIIISIEELTKTSLNNHAKQGNELSNLTAWPCTDNPQGFRQQPVNSSSFGGLQHRGVYWKAATRRQAVWCEPENLKKLISLLGTVHAKSENSSSIQLWNYNKREKQMAKAFWGKKNKIKIKHYFISKREMMYIWKYRTYFRPYLIDTKTGNLPHRNEACLQLRQHTRKV